MAGWSTGMGVMVPGMLGALEANAPHGEPGVDEVLAFVRRRFGPGCDARWVSGNCMWFAHIVTSRFPGTRAVYEPVIGHFLVDVGGTLVDWTGVVGRDGLVLWDWEALCEEDPTLAWHVARDCWL